MFRERTAAGTCKPYFVSRSKIRNLGAESKGKASRNCWTIHRLVGCLVTLKCKMRRRSWLIRKKQWSTLKVTVGTVKKSIAAMASLWLRRKASQRLAGSRFVETRFIQREMVLSETSKPSIRSSPWIRGAPQLGFSVTIWKMRSRTSFGVCLPPMGFLVFEIILQYQRNPARCHRTTVSGVTTRSACFHPDQHRRMSSQKSLSNKYNFGRGWCRLSTTSCWRSARFSRRRLGCERKRRRNVPKQRPRKRDISESYSKTIVETTAAMLLIPKSARVLANDKIQNGSEFPEPTGCEDINRARCALIMICDTSSSLR